MSPWLVKFPGITKLSDGDQMTVSLTFKRDDLASYFRSVWMDIDAIIFAEGRSYALNMVKEINRLRQKTKLSVGLTANKINMKHYRRQYGFWTVHFYLWKRLRTISGIIPRNVGFLVNFRWLYRWVHLVDTPKKLKTIFSFRHQWKLNYNWRLWSSCFSIDPIIGKADLFGLRLEVHLWGYFNDRFRKSKCWWRFHLGSFSPFSHPFIKISSRMPSLFAFDWPQ